MPDVKTNIQFRGNKGITIIEIIAALSLSMIVLLGIFRFYRNSLSSYNLQEQITEMHQNANYTIHLLTTRLMQAGVNLPDTNFSVISLDVNRYDSIEIKENQFAAEYEFMEKISKTNRIQLADASRFISTKKIVKQTKKMEAYTYNINYGYNNGQFINGIDTAGFPDSICLLDSVSFEIGDRIFGYANCNYFYRDKTLYLNYTSNPLAENIDSISITFFDKNEQMTIDWEKMRFAKIYARFRTSIPEPNYRDSVYNDGYHRTVMSMDLRLRNRFD